MKHLTNAICTVLLTLFAVTGHAQNKQAIKPSLFAGFPTAIDCTEAQLSSLFTAAKGENISVSLAHDLTLSGSVISKVANYGNLQTIIIQLPVFKNTLFSISKQTDQANNNTYVGRILNPLFADGFELKRNVYGKYQLIKTDVEKIIVNCNQ